MNAKTYKVLSIDAWADGDDGWTWNAWYNAGAIALDINSEDEAILEAMVDEGYITQLGASLSMVEDDGYNLIICHVVSGRPLYAIEYGSRELPD